MQQRTNGKHRRLDRRCEACAAPGELLRDERARDGVGAAAAVLGRNRVRRETHPSRLGKQVGRVGLALVPFVSDRPQLALGELVCEPLQLALLRGEAEGDPRAHLRVSCVTPTARCLTPGRVCDRRVPRPRSSAGNAAETLGSSHFRDDSVTPTSGCLAPTHGCEGRVPNAAGIEAVPAMAKT